MVKRDLTYLSWVLSTGKLNDHGMIIKSHGQMLRKELLAEMEYVVSIKSKIHSLQVTNLNLAPLLLSLTAMYLRKLSLLLKP